MVMLQCYLPHKAAATVVTDLTVGRIPMHPTSAFVSFVSATQNPALLGSTQVACIASRLHISPW
jgi:hypothetical protein